MYRPGKIMSRKPESLVIYVCGGVGSGKSTVLRLFSELYDAEILETDVLAHELLKKDQIGYHTYVELLGEEILTEDGELNRLRIAEMVFADRSILEKINAVLHPIVWKRAVEKIREFKERASLHHGETIPVLAVESAVLPPCAEFKDWVDCTMYIHSSAELRAKRLKESRAYSEEKIRSMFAMQPKPEEYTEYCDFVIENDGDIRKLQERLREVVLAMCNREV